MKTTENMSALEFEQKTIYAGGGPASHIDQGRRSRFPARVLLRPGSPRCKQWFLVANDCTDLKYSGKIKFSVVIL